MNPLLAVITAILLFFPSLSFAQTKEIISEGTYNMGDGETPSVAESRALLKAKQIAVEQAGTYVESYSKVKNITLTQDEIQVLASGLMEVEILDKKRTVVGDGINFWVKIKAKVNPDKMEEMAKRVKEKSVVEDYKRIQDAFGKSQKEIEELKKQLVDAQNAEAKKIANKMADEERLFQANEWFEKGRQYDLNRQYYKAIDAFTNAIALDNNFSIAFFRRGSIYLWIEQFDKAIIDLTNAITLNPGDYNAYSNRGVAYDLKGDPEKAIKDFTAAIAREGSVPGIYRMRGNNYLASGQKKKAVSDFRKSCDMGDENGCALLVKTLKKN